MAMADRIVIDPDAFLETDHGRVWTPERNEAAWAWAYGALEQAISRAPRSGKVILVCGVQGAGKTSWIASQPVCPTTIYFDAALPGMRHRARIIAIARQADMPIEAVWIDTPVAIALARNACRPADKVVPESAILSVAAQFEPPSLVEGFARVHVHKGG
ncbi:AAA family ATPase [Sphingomonas fuzhouensis]|uniref:AAA family ATPase n=1 Tax=Sphingomonas fuzhouensis TaxID=3106033 RepID=UPI002AFDD450|nr:AAA family ATPase [Sphingomonas sp. SGZ-02]